MGHTETIRHVKGVEMVEGDEGFTWVQMDVVTAGNVRKTVCIPHYLACFMGGQIMDHFANMDLEPRRKSWHASIAWVREKMRR